jgi:hypothetical protein
VRRILGREIVEHDRVTVRLCGHAVTPASMTFSLLGRAGESGLDTRLPERFDP